MLLGTKGIATNGARTPLGAPGLVTFPQLTVQTGHWHARPLKYLTVEHDWTSLHEHEGGSGFCKPSHPACRTHTGLHRQKSIWKTMPGLA